MLKLMSRSAQDMSGFTVNIHVLQGLVLNIKADPSNLSTFPVFSLPVQKLHTTEFKEYYSFWETLARDIFYY